LPDRRAIGAKGWSLRSRLAAELRCRRSVLALLLPRSAKRPRFVSSQKREASSLCFFPEARSVLALFLPRSAKRPRLFLPRSAKRPRLFLPRSAKRPRLFLPRSAKRPRFASSQKGEAFSLCFFPEARSVLALFLPRSAKRGRFAYAALRVAHFDRNRSSRNPHRDDSDQKTMCLPRRRSSTTPKLR
jgi:hypothetical protein